MHTLLPAGCVDRPALQQVSEVTVLGFGSLFILVFYFWCLLLHHMFPWTDGFGQSGGRWIRLKK